MTPQKWLVGAVLVGRPAVALDNRGLKTRLAGKFTPPSSIPRDLQLFNLLGETLAKLMKLWSKVE